MNVASLIEVKPNPNIPDLEPGYVVKVSAKIVEGGKERIQVFQGVVIRLRQGGTDANFTVRHVAHGIGVERTFPLYSPRIEKVEIVRYGKVRRAKLYYLRERSGKSARIKERRLSPQELEREREAARRLKEEALKLNQEQEQKQELELKQEEAPELEQEEAPELEQEEAPELEQEEAPELEQEEDKS